MLIVNSISQQATSFPFTLHFLPFVFTKHAYRISHRLLKPYKNLSAIVWTRVKIICRCATKNFAVQERFLRMGTSINISSTTHERKLLPPRGVFQSPSQVPLKKHFKSELIMNISFITKYSYQATCFNFQKRKGETFPSLRQLRPSCVTTHETIRST